MTELEQALKKIDSKLRLLKFTRDDVPRIQEKNELKAAERLQKALEQQIDSVHEQMVEIQALKIVVIEMGILNHFSNSQNFIKSTNKIPAYATDYKKEYLFIIGLDKELKYFADHINEAPTGLFESHKVDRIKYFIKRFLKGQERGKLKDISNLMLPKYYFFYIEDFYLNIYYEFEFDDNPIYVEFFDLIRKLYNKIKIEYFDDDIDGLLSSLR